MYLAAILEEINPWWRTPSLRPVVPPVRRQLQSTVFERLVAKDNRRAQVIFGPRQVGKTVLLLQLVHDLLESGYPPEAVIYFDFSDDRLLGNLSPREVVAARPKASAGGAQPVFFLDEVEYAHSWDRYLKQAVDQHRAKFVLTGSSAVHLRSRGRESGLGRWDETLLEPMCFPEYLSLLEGGNKDPERVFAQEPGTLERYLTIGGFPEHFKTGIESSVLVGRRLREDIAERAIMRDLARTGIDVTRAKDLFVYLAQESGSIFDARKLADTLQADARSIRQWQNHLVDTCLLRVLGRYGKGARSKMGGRQRPKIYAADHGLVNAFTPGPSPARDPDLRGRLYETTVYRHLRTLGEDVDLSYFRVKDDLEADFVVQAGTQAAVIEVTAGRAPTRRKIGRLNAAGDRLGMDLRVLIYGGVEIATVSGVHLLPFHRFLLRPQSVLEGYVS